MKRYWKTIAVVATLALGAGAVAACDPPPPIPGGAVMPTGANAPKPSTDDPDHSTTDYIEPVYPASTPTEQRCPSQRVPDSPPCTEHAGSTGAYSLAAYVCAQGNNYKGIQFPSWRTCMDSAIMQSNRWLPVSSIDFYAVDLWQHWNVDTDARNYWFQITAIYAAAFRYYGILGGAFTCVLLVAQIEVAAWAEPLFDSACELGFDIVFKENPSVRPN